MTVIAERVPSERTLLTVVDTVARKTANDAKKAMEPVVSGTVPKHRGATAAAMRPRVSRTATGHSLTIGPARGKRHPTGPTIAEVVRWVNKGTGLHRTGGGPKAKIHASGPFYRRGTLSVYGRQYRSVRGQRPNPFMDRIRAAGAARVDPILAAGAQVAARELEKVID